MTENSIKNVTLHNGDDVSSCRSLMWALTSVWTEDQNKLPQPNQYPGTSWISSLSPGGSRMTPLCNLLTPNRKPGAGFFEPHPKIQVKSKWKLCLIFFFFFFPSGVPSSGHRETRSKDRCGKHSRNLSEGHANKHKINCALQMWGVA